MIRISSPSTKRYPEVVSDVPPYPALAHWKYELREAEGEAKFRSIVAKVKAMAEGVE